MRITNYQQVWELWGNSKDKLHGYLLSKFRNKELADEVTQEVILKVYNSCCSQTEIKNPNSWLHQIAYNTALDKLKEESRHKNIRKEEDDLSSNSVWEGLSLFLNPLIQLLPQKYAVPLTMSDVEGVPQKDIALKLGLGLSATKSRIQRARTLLKSQIECCFQIEKDKNGLPIHFELKDTCSPLKTFEKNK